MSIRCTGTVTVVEKIYSLLSAMENCQKSVNYVSTRWLEKHEEDLEYIEKNILPSGAGIDSGCEIVREYKPERVVITFGFHHMNENGYYDGWENYILTVKPSFLGLNMHIKGKDRNQIKEYLYDTFNEILVRPYTRETK